MGIYFSIFTKLQKRRVVLRRMSTCWGLCWGWYILETSSFCLLAVFISAKHLMSKVILVRERNACSYTQSCLFILSTRKGWLWSSALVEGVRAETPSLVAPGFLRMLSGWIINTFPLFEAHFIEHLNCHVLWWCINRGSWSGILNQIINKNIWICISVGGGCNAFFRFLKEFWELKKSKNHSCHV